MAPPLTLVTITSGNSAAAVSVSLTVAVQSVSDPSTVTRRCGLTAVTMACSGLTSAGEHSVIQALSSWAGE